MRRAAFFLFWLFGFAGFSASGGQEKTGILYDDLGHPFSFGAPPRRIVSLAPNVTEILFALGLGDRIVGVTRFCDFPPEARAKEKVGGMIDPSPEKIEALHPDLIFAFRGNPIGILNKLNTLGFPVFVLETGITLEALDGTIEKIGRAAWAEEEAAGLVATLRQETALILDVLKNAQTRPRVFLALHGQGFWTCGRQSFLHDLIEKAGGENIAGRMDRRWLNLNFELLIRENPEVIVVLAKDEQAFLRARNRFLSDRRLKDIAAVRTGRIDFLDENSASRFGPRLAEALRRLAEILHPEKFGAVG